MRVIAQSGARWIVLSVKILASLCCGVGAVRGVPKVFRGNAAFPRGSLTAADIKKNHIQFRRGMRFYTQMKKNGQLSRGDRVIDFAAAEMEQMELYCVAHPGNPSAVRRPRLLFRSELWIALLGPSIEEGIVGIGPTVAAALRAFDVQYLAGLRLPIQAMGAVSAPRPPPMAFGTTRRRYQNAKSDLENRADASGFA